MSGHNRWSQIQHKKGAADQKRGQVFSKLAQAITLAARHGTDSETNVELRNVVTRARALAMPKDNIERAIKRAAERAADQLEELTVEIVGPEAVAFVVMAITDNRNRTLGELKKITGEYQGKLASPGSLLWQFTRTSEGLVPQYPITLFDPAVQERVYSLKEALTNQAEVQAVYTNYAHSGN